MIHPRTGLLLILVFSGAILLLAACGGGTQATATPLIRPFATVTIPPSFVPFGAQTATPTIFIFSATTSTSGFGPAVAPTITCNYPAGWFAYTVRSGDTLNVLADSIGSTVAELQVGNCISDADTIFVNQVLYLPNLPSVLPTSFITATNAVSTCPVPAGWFAYTVASGDTLSLLAFEIGSTLVELQSANCITNPDTIFVGQVLYLPRLPGNIRPTTAPTLIISTPIPNTTPITTPVIPSQPPVLAQLLRISPTTLRNDGASVTAQRTVTLDVGVVQNATRVRYFTGTSAVDQNPVLVGVDNNPLDGTLVNYTMNEFDNSLFFIAVAENQYGYTSSNIVHLVYDPNFNTTQTGRGFPSLQPVVSIANGIYTLTANSTVTVAWNEAPTDATRIDFLYLPSGGGAPQLIGSDATLADGAVIGWAVPSGVQGQLLARAVYADRVVDSQRINILSN